MELRFVASFAKGKLKWQWAKQLIQIAPKAYQPKV